MNFSVVIYDFGVKTSIIRNLEKLNCDVNVVNKKTSITELMRYHPDGVVLSNGPGDPAQERVSIGIICELLTLSIPVFGICLGHQLLALACGGKTKKMKYGHHGANHPVMDLSTREIFITSQNHGYVVDEETLPSLMTITHRSLFDNTIQGIAHRVKPVFGFQGHPEAGPGPEEGKRLFLHFLKMMTKRQKYKQNVKNRQYA